MSDLTIPTEVRFGEDYFFNEQAVGTTTAAQFGSVLRLGVTQGGLRVHAWTDGISCASGNTVTVALQVGDNAESTASSDWTTIESKVTTATGTNLTGDLFSFIPDTEKQFMRLSVANSTGMTGKFTACPEYVPR